MCLSFQDPIHIILWKYANISNSALNLRYKKRTTTTTKTQLFLIKFVGMYEYFYCFLLHLKLNTPSSIVDREKKKRNCSLSFRHEKKIDEVEPHGIHSCALVEQNPLPWLILGAVSCLQSAICRHQMWLRGKITARRKTDRIWWHGFCPRESKVLGKSRTSHLSAWHNSLSCL